MTPFGLVCPCMYETFFIYKTEQGNIFLVFILFFRFMWRCFELLLTPLITYQVAARGDRVEQRGGTGPVKQSFHQGLRERVQLDRVGGAVLLLSVLILSNLIISNQ